MIDGGAFAAAACGPGARLHQRAAAASALPRALLDACLSLRASHTVVVFSL